MPTVHRTAAETILLAALDCAGPGNREFSDWDLTVAAWIRDPQTFGMRGHQEHPDHKRAYVEITGRRAKNPLVCGLLIRPRKSVLMLTPLGRAQAAQLVGQSTAPQATGHYAVMSQLLLWPALQEWIIDPGQPRHFADVALWLGTEVRPMFGVIRKQVRAAIAWCNQNDVAYLTAKERPPIHFNRLAEALDFLDVLERRFPQLKGAA